MYSLLTQSKCVIMLECVLFLGVHGALIIFESRFNSELMGTLLAIPGNKTLLRRHLSLQFNELVGRHIVQEKRVAETAQDFIPLNPTTKVKVLQNIICLFWYICPRFHHTTLNMDYFIHVC